MTMLAVDESIAQLRRTARSLDDVQAWILSNLAYFNLPQGENVRVYEAKSLLDDYAIFEHPNAPVTHVSARFDIILKHQIVMPERLKHSRIAEQCFSWSEQEVSLGLSFPIDAWPLAIFYATENYLSLGRFKKPHLINKAPTAEKVLKQWIPYHFPNLTLEHLSELYDAKMLRLNSWGSVNTEFLANYMWGSQPRSK